MLEAVGNPNAVNPYRALRKVAADKGWNIHSFRNPVPLFQMPTGAEIGKTTGVVAAIAAAAAGGIWLAKKHRPDEA